MADQDFNIKVVTTADTTGLRQTSAELDKLKQQQATFAKTQAAATRPSSVPTQSQGGLSDTAGLAGSAVAIGTITALLTGAISRWKQFIESENQIIEKMEAARERTHELALEVAKIKDLDFSEQLNQTGGLDGNIGRLTQKIRALRAEQDALDPFSQAEEWKKLRAEVAAYQGQLDKLQAQKARMANDTLTELERRKNAVDQAASQASPQTKAALMNEQAERAARAQGDSRAADQFAKAAEDFKRSMTEAQRAELDRVHNAGRESQDQVVARKIDELKQYMQQAWGL